MAFSLEDHLYGFLKHKYNRSPQAVKSLTGFIYRLLPDSLKYGKTYIHYLSLLSRSQWWSKEKIEEYQWVRTKRLLQHSYDNVPYYRNIFNERGITLKDIQNFHDFKRIPCLTKNIIRDNLNDLVAKNIKKSDLISVGTGGSTGLPLSFYYEKNVSRPMEYAFMIHQWGRIGYRVGDKLAVLRGYVVKGSHRAAPSYFDPTRNRLVLSSFHLLDDNIPYYIEQIRRFRPKYLNVYPSSLTILARYMKKNQIDHFPTVRGILAGSENIHQWQLDLFQEVFQCDVFFWYGLNELVALGGICEFSTSYHLFPEYSYVEFIQDNDSIIGADSDAIYEIVGTSFCNDAMPFIRYRTMDYAVPQKSTCKCGRNYPLMEKVVGRKQEFLVDYTGGFVTFILSDIPLWPVIQKISAYQYVQEQPGMVTLNIENKDNFDSGDIETIRREFKEIYPRFGIDISLVEAIPRTSSGKFLYLKQQIPSDN